ncbi:hypothetical protein BsWGS_28778 [Bradybaena similaris]
MGAEDGKSHDMALDSGKINGVLTTKDKHGQITARLCLAAFGAVLGSFQFGYNTGVINSPESSIKTFLNDTEYARTGLGMSESKTTNLFALIVSIFAAGGCFGGLMAGWWANFFGRKKGLLLNTVFGIVAAVLMYFSRVADSYEMIVVGRFVVGFNCGLYTGLSPMYLFEISTPSIRGALGVLHQLGVTVGLLVSQVLGFSEIFGNSSFWDLLLGLTVVPCLLQVVILPFCPESPRYLLISRHKEHEAKLALEALRGTADVEADVSEMKQEEKVQSREEKVTVFSLFVRRSFRMPLLISIIMQLSQQLSGICGIFYYSASLYKDAGLDPTAANYATSGVGAVMVVMTLVTIPLMDRAGRRTLHLIGLAGMFVFSILITVTLALRQTVSWFNVLSIVVSLLYVVFFALGPGSIPWLIVAELFSQGPRAAAMSVAVLVNWISNFIVGYTFPHLQGALGDYAFVPFSVLLLVFWLFTFFYVKETNNKTFEQVSAMWKKVDEDAAQVETENTHLVT